MAALVRSSCTRCWTECGGSNTSLEGLKRRARELKAETYALYEAVRDPRSPWYAKLLAGAVVAYALSPIDLIPDFVPVLGYLDDLVIVPVGIWLSLKAIPPEVMEEARVRASESLSDGAPASRAAAVVVLVVWIVTAAVAGSLIWRMLEAR